MGSQKNKWPWAKDIKVPEDLQISHLLDAYSLNIKACSKGKHRPCKSNLRCVEAIVDKVWATDETPKPKNESKLKGKIPYSGLKNAGALCYCNVFLQLWYHNSRFRETIYKWHPVTDGGMDPQLFNPAIGYTPESSSLLGQLQAIFAEMEFGNAKVVDPIKLAEALNLNQNTHQDPQEFATLFLNLKGYILENITKKLYMIEYNNIVKCNNCGTRNTVGNSMMNIQLPLTSKQQTVTDIIKDVMGGEKLEGDNQYNCTNCVKKCDAVKKMEFTSLPPTCVYQVLRSKYDREKNRIVKLKTFLEIPQELDLSPYVSKDSKIAHTKYELKAVVVHLGTECSGGHYIVNIKSSMNTKWYSFNDTEVESMKTDCLVEGGKTGKASKMFPDSLLSNCAYMLVYDSMSEVDAVPTQPHWLGPLVDAKNAELANEDNSLRSEDERLNVEWTTNKSYVAEMMEKNIVSPEEDLKSDLVPLKWIHTWAEFPRTKEHIDTTSLLCPHKKLAFNKVFMTRVISNEVANHFYETFEGGPRLTLPECLCQDCIFTQCKLLQLKEAIEKDSKTILQDLKQTRKGGEAQFTEGFWVSKASFAKWRGLAKSRIEAQLAKTEDQTCENDDEPTEEENGIDHIPDEEEETTREDGSEGDLDKADPVPCKVRKISGESEAHNLANGDSGNSKDDTKKDVSPQEPDIILNSDLLCIHGALSTNESLRRIVPEKVWNILIEYFPNAHSFPMDHANCLTCESLDAENNQNLESKVEFARMIREQLPALIAFASTENASNKHVKYETRAFRPTMLHALSFDFVDELSKFVKNPTKAPRPADITNVSLICGHQLVHVDIGLNGSYDVMEKDKRFFVLVEPDEWKFLAQHFIFDYKITIQTSVDVNEPDKVDPGVCIDCLMERKKISEFNYINSYINIRKVEGDSTKQDNSKGQGRSRRVGRKQKDEFEIRVNASDTIRSVKSQIMKKLNNGCTFSDLHLSTDGFDGRILSNLDSSLADYEVPYNAVLFLKEDKVGEANSDDEYASAMLVDPEQGFMGTILAQQ